jgi:hypothetical protein
MAKVGFDNIGCKGLLKVICNKSGWSLCIGAGTSKGAFPDWPTLVYKLVASDVGDKEAATLLDALRGQASLDALIQAAQDRLKLSAQEFSKRLSTELYSDFRKAVGADWPLCVAALCANSPGDLKPDEWNKFLAAIQTKFPNLSATALAEIIADIADKSFAPVSIISFNAEPLLYALVNAFMATRKSSTHKSGSILFPKRPMDRVTQSISYRESGRIQFFHCHGLLPIEGAPKKFLREVVADKLVFSEGEYLQLANASFSWQASVFTSTSLFRSIVFVGLSFSDSNIRRWLAWVHANKMNELRLQGSNVVDSTEHYWISSASNKSANEKLWIESSVSHLGVRLIWLTGWGDLRACFRSMLK